MPEPNSGRPHDGNSTEAWLLLFVAGLCEVAWAIGLKYTEGFSRLYPSIATVAAMGASIGLLGLALKTIPVGTAYAVWTCIGAAGTWRLAFICLANRRPHSTDLYRADLDGHRWLENFFLDRAL
jgi:quaternary ammonium compound-resistance protein SugE